MTKLYSYHFPHLGTFSVDRRKIKKACLDPKTPELERLCDAFGLNGDYGLENTNHAPEKRDIESVYVEGLVDGESKVLAVKALSTYTERRIWDRDRKKKNHRKGGVQE